MIGKLDEAADQITFVSFDFPRAASAETLFEISQSKNKVMNADWQRVIREQLGNQGINSILIITGSLYFISEAKPYLLSLLKSND